MKKFFLTLLFITPFLSFAFGPTDSLKQKLTKLGGKDRISALLELCNTYRFLSPDSARMYGLEALRLSQRAKLLKLSAEAYHHLGQTYEAQGNYKRALVYANKALNLREQLKDNLGIGNSYNNIGIIYDDWGKFSLALEFYQKAHAIFKKHGNKEKQAMVISNLGVLFKANEDYEKAISYYQEALSLYTELKLPVEQAFCKVNLGSVYYYTGQPKLSLSYSLNALEALKKQNIKQVIPFALANAGLAYAEIGNSGFAEKFLSDALSQHKAFNNKKEMSFCYLHLAKIKLGQNNSRLAINQLKQAISLAKEIDARQQMMDANKVLATAYRTTGDYNRAFQAFETYTSLKDSAFKKDKLRLIADFQTKYETEKKEQEIETLHQQSVIQNLQIRQRNILLLISTLIIAFIAGLSYLLYTRRKFREEARLQTEINKHQGLITKAVLNAEEQERRRIASELHDGLGQLLSVALMNINSLYDKLKNGKIELSLAGRSISLISESYDEMRTISHQMIPTALIKTGLTAAIEECLNKMDHEKIRVNFLSSGFDKRVDDHIETVLYRVVQEAVNNVIKHAEATRLDIQLFKDEEGISLTVEDNGKGFDRQALLGKKGIGLRNMLDRIELLKGEADIDSSPGKGTLLTINIPCST